MAVNLLSLANKMRGSLHNSPSGSRTRNSYKNQPGNLKRTSHIPGTNIKDNSGGSLASKGRTFSGIKDSKIRNVDGRPSHVNKQEAAIIDSLGPMGAAWVKKTGAGTINPSTGLLEYGWLSSAWKKASRWVSKQTGTGTWKPSEGKWGIFGQTSASKARDLKKAQAKARHKSFEDFRRSYEDENIAGIFTEDTEDDTPKTAEFANKYNDFIMSKSGLNTPGGFIDATQISDYTDTYDTRKESELIDAAKSAESKLDLKEKAAFAGDITGQQATGAALSSSMFGMLTQSQDTTSQANFAGKGDFAQQFAEKQAIQEAERSFNAGKTEREMTLEETDIDRTQMLADTQAAVKDEQDDYNQEFWNNMVTWDTAINS